MSENNIKIRLIEDPRGRSPKQKCFSFRKQLDRSPNIMKTIKVLVGGFTLSHFLSAYLIITVTHKQLDTDFFKFKLAAMPLLALSIEVEILCIITIGIIISDIFEGNMSLAVWQRSAIGRVLQNFFTSLMFIVSFSLFISNIHTNHNFIYFDSIIGICTPLALLFTISLLKLVFIKTQLWGCWISIMILALLQLALVVLKIEYFCDIKWVVLFSPFVGICFVCAFTNFLNIKNKPVNRTAGIMASLAAGGSVLMFCMQTDDYFYDKFWSNSLGFGGFVIVFVFFSENVGNFVLDILLGHIETDYFHYVNPPKKLDGKIKSITM